MEPRVIKSDEHHAAALVEIERLVESDPELGTAEADRLDLLSLLVENYEKARFPVGLPTPVDAIKFRMEEAGLKQRDLIPYLGTKSRVSEVLSGKRPLTLAMARALHKELGIPAEVLLQDSEETMTDSDGVDWSRFPLKQMVKRGWITATTSEIKMGAENIIQEFLAAVPGGVPAPIYRRTFIRRTDRKLDHYALWAWCARVLVRAQERKLPRYVAGSVSAEVMSEVARLSWSAKGPLEAIDYLADLGVGVVVERHLPKTLLDGAVMISSGGNPLIGLTLRHDRLDSFWFTLLHELAHICRHLSSDSQQDAFVDDLDSSGTLDPREREADSLAGDAMIPRHLWRRSDAYVHRTPEAIMELAASLSIHPAIVAGRLRRDTRDYASFSQLVGNGLVRKLFSDVDW